MTRFNKYCFALLAVTTLLFNSCVKEELLEGKLDLNKIYSKTIVFSTTPNWGANSDKTKSGSSCMNRIGNTILSNSDSSITLPMGIYVQDGISYIDQNYKTKGAIISNASEINSFSVWAQLNKSQSEIISYFQGIKFTKSEDSQIYSPSQENEYFWPGVGTLDFIALANAPESGIDANLNDAKTQVTSLTYTVPTDPTKQNDILVAKTTGVDGNSNSNVALTFNHILSAVNFKVGTVANGVIKSITLNNIYSKGTYSLNTSDWSVAGDSKQSYSVQFRETDQNGYYEPNNKAEGTIINADNATFLMIPQALADDSEIVVEFIYDNAPSQVKQLRANLSKLEKVLWERNKTTFYTISIDENYNLSIIPSGDVLDAHYVMTDITINIDTETDQAWTLEVEATNISGDDVSIEFIDNLNPIIANEKYWIDKDDSGNSLRGGKRLTGTANSDNKTFNIRLFIPENITANERKVTLKLYLNNQPTKVKYEYLYQKYPYWDFSKDFGWERVENTETGQFGFDWDRVVCYTYAYTVTTGSINLFGVDWAITNDSYDDFNNIVDNLINTYNASSFVTKKYFDYDKGNSILDGFRACVIIDYTKIVGSDFFTFYDNNNGLANTKSFITGLNNAEIFAFENALASTTKNESGHEGELAFRIPYTDVDNGYTLADVNEGRVGITISNSPYKDAKQRTYNATFNDAATMDDMSGILKYIIQRNNFNVFKKIIGQNYYYEIDLDTENIKWYLPAVNQYANPVLSFATGNINFEPSKFWSSTADQTNNDNAFDGSGASILRTNMRQVVVQRINENNVQPSQVEIDNSSLQGGNNGSTNNWVE